MFLGTGVDPLTAGPGQQVDTKFKPTKTVSICITICILNIAKILRFPIRIQTSNIYFSEIAFHSVLMGLVWQADSSGGPPASVPLRTATADPLTRLQHVIHTKKIIATVQP